MNSWQEVDRLFNEALRHLLASKKSARESAQYAELANKCADEAEAQAEEAKAWLGKIKKKALLFKVGGVN